MPRIFACLAIGQGIVLIGTGIVGFLSLDVRADRHILLAVFSLLLSCLIQVVGFTYLTVTGKTMVQAVHFGGLDAAPLLEAKRLKRSFTRLLALLIGSIVVVTASGANLWRVGGGRGVHWVAALVVVSIHAFVLTRQYRLLVRNAGVVNRTLDEYSRRRAARAASAADLPTLSSS